MSESWKDSKVLPLYLSVLVTALMALLLSLDGRIWWCKFGDAAIYVNQAWGSSHTSQHFFDPYSLTHLLHGVLFFWLTVLIFKNRATSQRFLIATIAEAAWELIENSDYVIQQYRENTASLDYFGDSIANSVGDVLACAVGFWIAVKIGWWRSLVFFVLVELVLLSWIRDSLVLNVIMLIHPIEWVKAWQTAS